MTKKTKNKQAEEKQDKENESASLQFEIGKAVKALQKRCKDWQSNELHTPAAASWCQCRGWAYGG